MTRERVIEAYLAKEVRRRNGLALKLSGDPGFPDRTIVLPDGRIAFAELKTATGVLSATQKRWIRWLEGRGHRVTVIRSREEVDQFVMEIFDGGFSPPPISA